MRVFKLIRLEDVSGISGVGEVCEGAEFSDGTCVVHWMVGEYHTTEIHPSIKSVMAIHGHNGKTKLEFTRT